MNGFREYRHALAGQGIGTGSSILSFRGLYDDVWNVV